MTIPLLRISTCLLAAAAALEFCARIEDTATMEAPLWGPYHQNILYDKPGADFHGVPGARYLKWKLNSLGYRGAEPAPGEVRVACVGASETFGLYESENREWPRQLEAALNAGGGRAYTVINTAYPGSNLKTHLHQAPRMIEKAKPDIVVLYTSVAAYAHSDFYGVLKADKAPEWQSRIGVKAKEMARRMLPDRWRARLYEYLTERSLRGREDQVSDRIPEANVELFAADLDRLLDFYAAKGIRTVVVTHAQRFGREVKPEEMPLLVAWRNAYPVLRENGFLDMEERLNEKLRRAAAARGLPLADAARDLPAGPRYFADYVHFTDEGAGVLARTVAPAVLAQAKPQ